MVTHRPEDLGEDLEEESEPVQECSPHLNRPRGIRLGLSQLGHRAQSIQRFQAVVVVTVPSELLTWAAPERSVKYG